MEFKDVELLGSDGVVGNVVPIRRVSAEPSGFPWAEVAVAVLTTAVSAILTTPQAQQELGRVMRKLGNLVP